jgi:enterochelin esterase-like enzyme
LLEPQSTVLFLLLMVAFGALVWWVIVAKQVVFRVLAACLAFVPAMMFGVVAVNKYYDYYQNWSAAIADFTNQGVKAAEPQHATSHTQFSGPTFLGQSINRGLAAAQGFTLRLTVHGSGISRTVYVFLPPQYFQAKYQGYRFPVIELIHGFPGLPQDWITVLNVNSTLDSLVRQGVAKPAVLVMPDANGGLQVSLQCLNQVGGPQDDSYLAHDVPDHIAKLLRVQPPGDGWAIAGYSEGGFCAANLGLQHGNVYSYAGVMSGYFAPSDNQLANPSRLVAPFGGNLRLRRQNTPLDLVRSLPLGREIPEFWLGAGAADSVDVHNAQYFQQLLELRQPVVTLKLVPGGGHTMFTWRTLLPPMLEWMTPKLTQEADLADAHRVAEHRALLRKERAARQMPRSRHTRSRSKRRRKHARR